MDSQEVEEAIGYVYPADMRHGHNAVAGDLGILRRLSANDTNIQSLDVYFYDDGNAEKHDWAKELGLAISKSTHLRSLSIYVSDVNGQGPDDGGDDDDDDDDVQPPRPQYGWLSLFMGLAENRSIEIFHLESFDHSHMNIFKTLAPFFEHNHNLHYIEIHGCRQLSERVPYLISALKQTHGLKCIHINYNELGDSVAANLIDALRSMPGLHHLVELTLRGNKIGQQGCAALRKLLRHPACKIQCLRINDNHLDNVCMDILNGGLVTNNSIKYLPIERQKFVTASGWGVFFDLYSNSICSVERIDARENEIGDDGMITLGNSFAINSRIKKLDLRSCRSITPVGWQGFSKGLKSPNCPLLELNISDCEINDEGALAIASALGQNTLKKLDMSSNGNISSSGWIDCFHIMRQQEVTTCLKQLNLSRNNIDDEGATMLVTILVKMSALVSFSLLEMNSVSSDGWRQFADVVKPSSSSTVHELRLGGVGFPPPQMDDSVIIRVAGALIGNANLTAISFINYRISDVGWCALANCLCNKSSPINTFHSNHTLKRVGDEGRGYNTDFQSLIDMNKLEDKVGVARKKILATHFGDNDACIRIFAPMATPTLPTALSWIGRDRREYSMMYQLLHSMPWPLESTA